MIHLIASANAHYANRITAWLDAACVYAHGWRIWLAGVVEAGDLAWLDSIANCYPPSTTIPIDRAWLPFLPPLDHLQAGGFLDVLRMPDDDLIIFTDGDAYLQRPPTAAEQQMLANWPAGVIGLAYNAGPDDTLATEAARLKPRADVAEAGFDLSLPIYNLGVIVARAGDYRRWLAAYVPIQPRVAALFDHHAHQQWGLCAAIPDAGLRVSVLPATLHTHGHYPPPPGVTLGRERGRITANGEIVLFRHHL
jgi:hypothetical protein